MILTVLKHSSEFSLHWPIFFYVVLISIRFLKVKVKVKYNLRKVQFLYCSRTVSLKAFTKPVWCGNYSIMFATKRTCIMYTLYIHRFMQYSICTYTCFKVKQQYHFLYLLILIHLQECISKLHAEPELLVYL